MTHIYVLLLLPHPHTIALMKCISAQIRFCLNAYLPRVCVVCEGGLIAADHGKSGSAVSWIGTEVDARVA